MNHIHYPSCADAIYYGEFLLFCEKTRRSKFAILIELNLQDFNLIFQVGGTSRQCSFLRHILFWIFGNIHWCTLLRLIAAETRSTPHTDRRISSLSHGSVAGTLFYRLSGVGL